MNALDLAKEELNKFEKTMVTWSDYEKGTCTMNEYRRDIIKRDKLSSVYNKLWSEDYTQRSAKNRELRLKKATLDWRQEYADRLHSVMCDCNHEDMCDYHYGNWDTDIRNSMLDFYEYWVRLENSLGLKNAERHLDVLESADHSKEVFEKLRNG